MNTPQTPAARTLADLQARGVTVTIIPNNSPSSDGIVNPWNIQLSGGKMLPGDWDKVKLYKSGLITLLKAQKAYGMAVGDWQDSSEVKTVFPSFDPIRGTGPQYKSEIEDEKLSPEISAPKVKHERLDESKPKKVKTEVENWAKPLPPKRRASVFQTKRAEIKDPALVGQKIHKWKILEVLQERNENSLVMWLCECECGTIKKVPGAFLRRESNPLRSCGCGGTNNPKADWESIDWSQSNKAISTETGCHYATVLINRKKYAPETLGRRNKGTL